MRRATGSSEYTACYADREQHRPRATQNRKLQTQEQLVDAGVVGDFTVFIQRHVEVHADDRAFALEIVRIDFEHNSKYLMVERAGSTTGYNVTNLAK